MSEGLLGAIRHELAAIYSDVYLWTMILMGIVMWLASGAFLYSALLTACGAFGYIWAGGHR